MFTVLFEAGDKQEISNSISRFIHTFKVGSLLEKCNYEKEKSIPFAELSIYALRNVFRDRSMYMQKKTGSLRKDFSRNIYYRFLHNARSNSFIPINFFLLVSSKEENILGEVKPYDRRPLVGRRRIMTRRKGTDIVIQLIDEAMKAGHKAGYVLFDSWFPNLHQIVESKDKGLDTIAMVKVSSRIGYEFNGECCNIKQIYNGYKERHGRPRYPLPVPIRVGQDKKDGYSVDAGIAYVRNRVNRRDQLALVCTDMSLHEGDIIGVCGKRWDIKVFSKTYKSFLNLGPEYHGLFYDAPTVHMALMFIGYILMSVVKHGGEDERILGELFYFMVDGAVDIAFSQSVKILPDAMLASIRTAFQASEEQISIFMNDFVSRLPEYMQKFLLANTAA